MSDIETPEAVGEGTIKPVVKNTAGLKVTNNPGVQPEASTVSEPKPKVAPLPVEKYVRKVSYKYEVVEASPDFEYFKKYGTVRKRIIVAEKPIKSVTKAVLAGANTAWGTDYEAADLKIALLAKTTA